MSTKGGLVHYVAECFVNPVTSPSSVIRRPFSGSKTRTGGILPKYRTIIRNGGHATTPFTGSKQTFTPEHNVTRLVVFKPFGLPRAFQKRIEQTVTGATSSTSFGVFPGGSGTASYSKANQRALQLAYKRIRERQMDMSGPVFIAELRQTVGLIRGTAKRLADGLTSYVSAVRKSTRRLGRRSTRRDFKQIVADRWLEYSFGLQPLLSDVDGFVSALAKTQYESSRRARIKVSAVDDALVSQSASSQFLRADVVFRQRQTVEDQVMVIYHIYLRAELDYPQNSIQNLARRTGFNLREFVPTVWEILPWSFLVDYFVNVGQILEAAFTDTSDILGTGQTIRRKTELKLFTSTDEPAMRAAYGKDYESSSFTGSAPALFADQSITRSASGIYVPSLSFSFPGKPAQWCNMTALKVSSSDITSLGRSLRR